MPFGISLAPEVFESRLEECLADLPGMKVIRDHILVVGYGETDSEALLNHDQNVVYLLERVKQVHLKLNKDKVFCFDKQKLNSWGNVISRDGLNRIPIKLLPSRTCQSQQLSLKFLPCLILSTI